jgi:nitroimidazol reductase NimA-like FMN-containing flavoprotein (pyridoxamine 5'-phosphate oxidase superfamily)
MNITQRRHPLGLEELPVSECMELLAAKRVGRHAVNPSTGPQIFPVNFVLQDGNIFFRTSPHSRLAGLVNDTSVAFEVDEIDEFLECGWSVLAVGTAHLITDPSDLSRSWADRPEPWAPGARSLYVRIEPTEVTGRRVHPS